MEPIVLAAIIAFGAQVVVQAAQVYLKEREHQEKRKADEAARHDEATQAAYNALLMLTPAMADFAELQPPVGALEKLEEAFIRAREPLPRLPRPLREHVRVLLRQAEHIRLVTVEFRGLADAARRAESEAQLPVSLARHGTRDERERAAHIAIAAMYAAFPDREEPLLRDIEAWRERVAGAFLDGTAPDEPLPRAPVKARAPREACAENEGDESEVAEVGVAEGFRAKQSRA